MTDKLDDKLINEAEAMIARRMQNTGESREEACNHIANYLQQLMK